MSRRYFFDMDGTLFEWKNVPYDEMLYEQGYFRDLKPNTNIVKAMNNLLLENPEQVFIASKYLDDSEYAKREKMEALNRIAPLLKKENIILISNSESKINYIPGGVHPEDILIDDYTTNLLEWEKEGGLGIKYMNGINHTMGRWEGTKIYANHQNLKNDINECIELGSKNYVEYKKKLEQVLYKRGMVENKDFAFISHQTADFIIDNYKEMDLLDFYICIDEGGITALDTNAIGEPPWVETFSLYHYDYAAAWINNKMNINEYLDMMNDKIYQYEILDHNTSEIETISANNITFDYVNQEIVGCNLDIPPDNMRIPDNINGIQVKSIGEFAFECYADYSFKEIWIPEGVKSIGDYAFFNNSITHLHLPDSLEEIGEKAFYGNLLKDVTIPDSVKTIGKDAFSENILERSIIDKVSQINNYKVQEQEYDLELEI